VAETEASFSWHDYKLQSKNLITQLLVKKSSIDFFFLSKVVTLIKVSGVDIREKKKERKRWHKNHILI
jgi:hypothetical protein